jgi:hypothetical protein
MQATALQASSQALPYIPSIMLPDGLQVTTPIFTLTKRWRSISGKNWSRSKPDTASLQAILSSFQVNACLRLF